jgi:hypothetical protein
VLGAGPRSIRSSIRAIELSGLESSEDQGELLSQGYRMLSGGAKYREVCFHEWGRRNFSVGERTDEGVRPHLDCSEIVRELVQQAMRLIIISLVTCGALVHGTPCAGV